MIIRYDVQRPDGSWACFSNACNDFITDFMSFDEYNEWRTNAYGENCVPIEESNRLDYEVCLSIRRKAPISDARKMLNYTDWLKTRVKSLKDIFPRKHTRKKRLRVKYRKSGLIWQQKIIA